MTKRLASTTTVAASGKRGRGLTLSSLMDEMKQRGERGRAEARARLERSVEFYNGIQKNDSLMVSDSDIVDPPRRNYLRNVTRTALARLIESRQFPKVWPARADERVIMAAEAANALLKYQRHRVAFDQWSWDTCRRAVLGGRVGVVPYWDETRGDPIYGPSLVEVNGISVPEFDEQGRPVEELLGYEGEVVWRVLETHEYCYWPVPRDRDLSECKALYVESDLDEYDALALLDDDEANVQTEEHSGRVRVQELWYVPCHRIPKGLHAIVVGEQVAVFEDWNLPFTRIPLAEFGLDPIDGSQYFTSPFHDAIDSQRMLNDKEAAKFATVRRTGHPVLLGVGSLAEEIHNAGRGGPGRVPVTDINLVNQGARWFSPPDPHPLVFQTQEEDIRSIYDSMGVSEVSSGSESAKAGVSARGIAYMDHLDAQKISGDVRSLERFTRDLFWLTLELYRAMSGEERRVRVFGGDSAVKEFAFRGADLDGYDLVYEPTDGKLEMHASQSMAAGEQMQSAGPVPELMERAQTGLGQSSGTVDQRKKLAEMAQRAMSGEAVQPDPSIPPGVALAVLRVFKGERGVDTLIAAYEQQATQQSAAGEFGGATPGPKPGAPQNK